MSQGAPPAEAATREDLAEAVASAQAEKPESALVIQNQRTDERKKIMDANNSTTTTGEDISTSQSGLEETTDHPASNEAIHEKAPENEVPVSIRDETTHIQPPLSHDHATKESEVPPDHPDIEMTEQADDAATEPTEATEEV